MRSILKRKSLLAVDLSLPMRLRGHFKGLSKGASKFGQWVAPWVPFWGFYKKATEENRQKHSWSANEIWNVFLHEVHVSRYAKKGILFWGVPMVPNELYSGHRAAFIWNGLCRLYICIFHTHGRKTHRKPTSRLAQNSAAIRYPNATESEELWYRKKIHPKWVRNIESPHTHQLVQDFTHQNCTPWFCWGSHCAPSFASSSPRRYLRLQPASKFGPNGIFQVQKKGWMWSLANRKGSKLKRFGLNKIENSWCFISNFDFSGYQFFLLKEKTLHTKPPAKGEF